MDDGMIWMATRSDDLCYYHNFWGARLSGKDPNTTDKTSVSKSSIIFCQSIIFSRHFIAVSVFSLFIVFLHSSNLCRRLPTSCGLWSIHHASSYARRCPPQAPNAPNHETRSRRNSRQVLMDSQVVIDRQMPASDQKGVDDNGSYFYQRHQTQGNFQRRPRFAKENGRNLLQQQ